MLLWCGGRSAVLMEGRMDGGRVKSEQIVLKVGQDSSVTTMVPTANRNGCNDACD